MKILIGRFPGNHRHPALTRSMALSNISVSANANEDQMNFHINWSAISLACNFDVYFAVVNRRKWMAEGKKRERAAKSETYTSAISHSLLDNIKLLCYSTVLNLVKKIKMDDTQLRYRYLIDSSCGGVTFSDLLKKST